MAEWMLWAAGGGALLVLVTLVIAAFSYAPAKTSILIDTAGSTARAEMKPLWGLGPLQTKRYLPPELAGNPLPPFQDPLHIGHALMTPGLADVTYVTIQRLVALKPHSAKFVLGLNLADSGHIRVVQTAVQAVLATAPRAMREAIEVTTCEAPGAEVSARFELDVSPAKLSAIANGFKNSRAAREFFKRLRRKQKTSKKAPREVAT